MKGLVRVTQLLKPCSLVTEVTLGSQEACLLPQGAKNERMGETRVQRTNEWERPRHKQGLQILHIAGASGQRGRLDETLGDNETNVSVSEVGWWSGETEGPAVGKAARL